MDKKSVKGNKKGLTVKDKAKALRKEVNAIDRNEVVEILSRAGDKEMQEEYLHIFDELKISIRIFERNLKLNPHSRNVYALMALYTQMREVIADIRSLTDYSEHANQVINDVIQPLFSAITQSNLDVFYHLRQIIIETSDDKKTQYALKKAEALMREQSRYLQERYLITQNEVVKSISSR